MFDPDDDDVAGSVGGYSGHQLRVIGHGWIVKPKHHDFVAPETVLAPASIESLRVAMLDDRRCCSQLPGSTEYIHVALESSDDFHALTSPVDPVTLWVESDNVFAVVEAYSRREPPWREEQLADLLLPAASQHGCTIERVAYEGHGGAPDAWKASNSVAKNLKARAEKAKPPRTTYTCASSLRMRGPWVNSSPLVVQSTHYWPPIRADHSTSSPYETS